MRNKFLLTVVAAGAIGFAGVAKAVSVDTLANLVNNNGTLTIDDKVFSDFGYQASGLSSFNPAGIVVTATQLGDVEYLTWTGNMSVVGPAGTTADLLLTYTVTALHGHKIDTIDQFFVGNSVPSGTGLLSIDELVLNANNNTPVASSHLEIGDISDPPGEGIQGDDLIINPALSKLNVIKDIGYGITARNGGLVMISAVRQSFHQPPIEIITRIPETGTTFGLLGLALAGLGLLRKKFVA